MLKYIKDPIYNDYLKFENEQIKLIDNKYFKRLKNIKQLGSLHEVFPSATHTRFEHSLGVSNLGEKFTKCLFNNSGIRLTSNNLRTIRNIKIAGLYHDIGHGPFSHVFDHHVLHKLCPRNVYAEHENRSCLLVEHVIKNICPKDFNGYDIDFIKNCIDPKEQDKNKWEFGIIANKINSIDVDKFDYLIRDPYHIGFNYSFDHTRLFNKTRIINNEIYYHKAVVNDIYDMYSTRYNFHREIYNHKAVKAVELMIGDILLDLDNIYNFNSIIGNPEEFYKLTDGIIDTVYLHEQQKNSQIILDRIANRDFYKEIYRTEGNDLDAVKDEILDTNKDTKEDDYHFVKMKFDFCNGDKSPFTEINFYEKTKKVDFSDLPIRKLQPEIFRESIISVYKK